MFMNRQPRMKPTVVVTAIGCLGLVLLVAYLVSSDKVRAQVDRWANEAFGSAIEVVRHKQSGEYVAKLPGGRIVKLSGREEAEAIMEHGYSACESCQ